VLPDDELNRLYGLPLDEFTRARDALARDLRKAGERETADEAKALVKPSLSAWTVNQLARREPLQMRALRTAGERLREAQAGVLRGGDAEELQAALRRQRDVVAALVESSRRILEADGHTATDSTLERIRGTLTAAAADSEGAQLVEHGRLTRDLEPAGFGGLAVPSGPTTRRSPARRRKEDETRKRRVQEAKRAVDEARAAVADQEARLRRARSEVRRAEADLERATARLDAATTALERARR
jgi:hypothetical protein